VGELKNCKLGKCSASKSLTVNLLLGLFMGEAGERGVDGTFLLELNTIVSK
jgi:hypothetical protein